MFNLYHENFYSFILSPSMSCAKLAWEKHRYEGDPRPCLPPWYYSVISHGAQFRGLPVFSNHIHKYAKTNAKKNASTISACHAAFYFVFIFMLRPQLMQVTYTPDKLQLFWLWEKPEDPQFEPHIGVKMVQVLGSPLYICGEELIYITENSPWPGKKMK